LLGDQSVGDVVVAEEASSFQVVEVVKMLVKDHDSTSFDKVQEVDFLASFKDHAALGGVGLVGQHDFFVLNLGHDLEDQS